MHLWVSYLYIHGWGRKHCLLLPPQVPEVLRLTHEVLLGNFAMQSSRQPKGALANGPPEAAKPNINLRAFSRPRTTQIRCRMCSSLDMTVLTLCRDKPCGRLASFAHQCFRLVKVLKSSQGRRSSTISRKLLAPIKWSRPQLIARSLASDPPRSRGRWLTAQTADTGVLSLLSCLQALHITKAFMRMLLSSPITRQPLDLPAYLWKSRATVQEHFFCKAMKRSFAEVCVYQSAVR